MEKRNIRLGEVIEMIVDYYAIAMRSEVISKPLSWSLHNVWMYVDSVEKERENGTEKK